MGILLVLFLAGLLGFLIFLYRSAQKHNGKLPVQILRDPHYKNKINSFADTKTRATYSFTKPNCG